MTGECGGLTVRTLQDGGIEKWKEKSGPGATYGNLLRIFVKARHLDCADALCDMLRKKCEPCPVLTRIMCCDVCPSPPLQLSNAIPTRFECVYLRPCLSGCG